MVFQCRILTIFLTLSGSIVAENISAQNIRLKLQDVALIDANEGFIYPVEVSIDWAKPDQSRSSDDFWIGIYPAPVPRSDSSLPRHELKISILRGEQSVARFAVTRNEPERR